jgi:hypothetical protein
MIVAVASSATLYKSAEACPDRLTPTTHQTAANALMMTDPIGLTPVPCGPTLLAIPFVSVFYVFLEGMSERLRKGRSSQPAP